MKKVKIYELSLLAWAGLAMISLLASIWIVDLFITITQLENLNKPLDLPKTSLSFSLSEILTFVLFFAILILLSKPFGRWVVPILNYLEDKWTWLFVLAIILIGIAFYHFNS